MIYKLYYIIIESYVKIRSFILCALLRLIGLKIGRNIKFYGKLKLKLNGKPSQIEISDNVVFAGAVDLRNRENGSIKIGKNCFFDDGLRLVSANNSVLQIGDRTAVGLELIINAGDNVTIGADCMFSSHINIHSSTHLCKINKTISEQGYDQKPVCIGEDVWVASNVNILYGSIIGDQCIVAPNSLVHGTFREKSVLCGVPVVVVSKRNMTLDPLKQLADSSNYYNSLCHQVINKL